MHRYLRLKFDRTVILKMSMGVNSSCSLKPLDQVQSRHQKKNQQPKWCKRIQVLWLKRKGAILVLMWWHFLLCGYYLIRHKSLWQVHGSRIVIPAVAFAVVTLISPVAGWLADARFGRYNVLKWGIWIAWISSMLLTVSSVIAGLVTSYEQVNSSIIEAVTLFVMMVGIVGCFSNIIQFSMDQLPDASTEEIVSFIRWLVWTYFSSGAVLNYTLFCTKKEYKLIGLLVVSGSLTIAVCLDILFNHHLVKEPPTENPFKLVFEVVRYAIKNKQPRYRSAFTYSEDRLPSRIDFGKAKYGGPFTTEQVEDVKTFVRLLIVVVVSGALPGPTFFLEYAQSRMINQFVNPTDVVDGCYTAKDLSFVYFGCGFIAIPLYDFVIRPIFYKCIPSISSYWKILLGFFLLLLQLLAFMSIDLIANQKYTSVENTTLQCLFSDNYGVFESVLDHRWFSIIQIIECIFTLLAFIGILEFLCAQIPYTMKGVFMGSLISIVCVSFALGAAAFIPFTLNLSLWSKSALSYGFWYFLTEAIAISTGLLLLMAVFKWYKKRRREDVLPNEQIFAERYYSS